MTLAADSYSTTDFLTPSPPPAAAGVGGRHLRIVLWHGICALPACALAIWAQLAGDLSPAVSWTFAALAGALLLQPLVFRLSGAFEPLSAMSVLLLNGLIFLAAYQFGGLAAPVLTVSMIVPVLCLLHMRRAARTVGLAAWAAGYGGLWLADLQGHQFPSQLPTADPAALHFACVVFTGLVAGALVRAHTRRHARSRAALLEAVRRQWQTAADGDDDPSRTQPPEPSLITVCRGMRMPLNAIIGFAEIISRELMGRLEDQRYRACAADIESSGRHLLQVVDGVLTEAEGAEHRAETTT
ncbi:MAG: hypothetical protein QF578_12875 [Alphaproteobacteria bacterium]|nr:hypothetical protein [Alphaproteobacteria bacterium]MDP6814979.1 hypothetical protein [Alphaproteobacteria bacterium]